MIYNKYPTSLLLPVAVSTGLIIVLLLIFQVPYDVYMVGGDWINELLGPAVVALAYPLYMHRNVMIEFAFPLSCGILIGAIVGVSSGAFLAKWAGFADEIVLSLSPKSVTTPVAMEIAQISGGLTSLTAVFVMIAGIGGTMVSTYIFRLFHITNAIGRGVGIGSASHAIGTAKAMEHSPVEGAVSTVAMVISAVYVSILIPILSWVFM